MKAKIFPDIRILSSDDKDNGWSAAFFLSLRVDNIDTFDPCSENRQLE